MRGSHGCSPGRPLPESLDRVARVMAGETSDAPRPPLAETCTFCGKRPPQFVFFAVSGTLGNVIQLGLDRLFVTFVFDDSLWWAPTLSWTASYSLSIAFRHFSHAFLVFGPPAGHWAVALAKTYATYFTTIVASTATNLFFVTSLRMRHELALVGVHRQHLPPVCARHCGPRGAPRGLEVVGLQRVHVREAVPGRGMRRA